MPGYAGADVVAEIAADQWGLVTASDARDAGLTTQHLKRLADHDIIERVHYGIYRVSRFPHDRHQDLRVAWTALDPRLAAGERLRQSVPTGVVSHRSAAHLLELGDLDADIGEFTTTRRVRLSLPHVRIHVGTLTRSDWELVDGLPVTTAERTIADLAGAGIDGDHLGGIVRDALQRGRTTVSRMEATLAAHAFTYGHAHGDGAGLLRALLEEAGISADLVDFVDFTHPTRSPFQDFRPEDVEAIANDPSIREAMFAAAKDAAAVVTQTAASQEAMAKTMVRVREAIATQIDLDQIARVAAQLRQIDPAVLDEIVRLNREDR